MDKLALTTAGCPLVIQCKNFRIVHFVVPRERDCHDVYNSLLQLSKQGARLARSLPGVPRRA